MSWRDSLQVASFRGVKFRVDSIDTEFGRRSVLHEYPKRDIPYVEDLGKKARTYQVSAYVIGDDYITDRDRLIEAIENRSVPGTLIHPTLGSLEVFPVNAQISWSNKEGGFETFTISFSEAGENRYPASNLDTQAAVKLAADNAMAETTGSFGQQFSVIGLPQFLSESSKSIVLDTGNSFDEALKAYPSNSETLPQYKKSVDTLRKASIRNSLTLGEKIVTLSRDFRAALQTASGAYLAFKGLLSFGQNYEFIPLTTVTRRKQAENQLAQITIVRQNAAIGMAMAASDLIFSSYNEASLIREEISQVLEAEILNLGSTNQDTLLNAMAALKASCVVDITSRGANLERIRTLKFEQSIPSLVLSYNQYQDLSKESEILARNSKIKHPGFIPAMEYIEVLTA